MVLNSTLAGLHVILDTMNYCLNRSDCYKGGALERENFRIPSFDTSNEELDVECVYFSDENVEYTAEADIAINKYGFTFALLLLLFVALGLRVSGKFPL